MAILKIVVVAALIGIVASQAPNFLQMMMMSQMFNQQGGGGNGANGASSSSGGSESAGNPQQAALLCRQTDNFRPIPCKNNNFICDMLSQRSYQMPGLLTCSPMGFGCCIKDMMSLFMARRNA